MLPSSIPAGWRWSSANRRGGTSGWRLAACQPLPDVLLRPEQREAQLPPSRSNTDMFINRCDKYVSARGW